MSVESARDQTVSLVVNLLVAGRYDELSRLGGGESLGAQELASAVAEYGRTLVPPPASRQPPDFIRITGTPTEAWSVVAPLYTQEEGLSDLSLELTLTRDPQALPYGYRIALDNLHVL
jgi:hypothetical protein